MNNILVLCIGNICRSPMAEALLRKKLPGHVIHSAGLGALVGKPADPLAQKIMAEQGIDIKSHRARQVTSQLVIEADLILVMDSDQKRDVGTRYIGSAGKVFRLGEFKKVDVQDPYREGIDSFRAAYTLIDEGVESWVEQINRLK